MAPMGQTFTQHPQATHSLCATTAFLFLRLPVMSIPPRVNMDIMIGRTGVFFRDEITENACRDAGRRQRVEKVRLHRPFPPGHVSPAPSARPGKRARKPCYARLPNPPHMSLDSEYSSEGCGPPNLPEGFFDSLGRHGICHAAFFHAGSEKSRRVFFDATALLDCV